MSSARIKEDAAFHGFDAKIAVAVSVNSAIIYRNIVFWVRHNETNGKNFHDGRYWTYNSLAAFGSQFPYLTLKQIRTALDRLIEVGLVVKGNYAKDKFKRANWYSLGETISPDGQMEVPLKTNESLAHEGSTSAPQGKCIKNRYKQDSKPYPPSVSAEEIAASDFDLIWKSYPEDRRRDRAKCKKYLVKILTQVSLEELTAAIKSYASESEGFQRSKVSFIDNWLRDGKWQRHVDDLRSQLTDIKTHDRLSCPVSSLRVIASNDAANIAKWDEQLARWDLPPLRTIATRGQERGEEGWLWPLKWVPSDSVQSARVEEYARWLLKEKAQKTSRGEECLHEV